MSTTSLQALAWPMLRKGLANNQVRTAQYLLRQRGHQIVADNIFGPNTDAAVRAFQSAAHLTVDGIIGPRTWSALIVTVRRGSRGDAVRAVQVQGSIRHEPTPPATAGMFGPVTESYVQGFQQVLGMRFPANHVAVDGIVGPVTWHGFVAGIAGLD
jgi:peptidoglycan hydrolase-like protein with peptidoglycan-binding domain